MEIFHELYGRYYQNVTRILLETPCTREVMEKIIKEQGFEESLLFLLPKITDKAEWNLLEKEEDLWYSKLLYEPYTPTTKLERRWMKTQLNDRRVRLFLSEDLREQFLESLKEEKPLYQESDFDFFDRNKTGDPYEKESYQKAMRTILRALYRREETEITYQNKKERYLPLRLSYSMKEDCFRLYAVSKNQTAKGQMTIFLMSRVTEVKALDGRIIPDVDVQQWMKERREEKPAVVRVHDERKALERFMIQMTDYEKETQEEKDDCVCVRIFYRPEQRGELLERFLSMGPMLEVLEPQELRLEMKKRIRDQVRRFF
ncbi:MAG: WYL domain-containing protein [Eubacteriales bacterium]|nr:WYL domain-containing protein [Eubacteriales bacterium]